MIIFAIYSWYFDFKLVINLSINQQNTESFVFSLLIETHSNQLEETQAITFSFSQLISWISNEGLPLFYQGFHRICITVNWNSSTWIILCPFYIAALKNWIKCSFWFIISLFIVFSWSPRCYFVSKISFISHHLSYEWP